MLGHLCKQKETEKNRRVFTCKIDIPRGNCFSVFAISLGNSKWKRKMNNALLSSLNEVHDCYHCFPPAWSPGVMRLVTWPPGKGIRLKKGRRGPAQGSYLWKGRGKHEKQKKDEQMSHWCPCGQAGTRNGYSLNLVSSVVLKSWTAVILESAENGTCEKFVVLFPISVSFDLSLFRLSDFPPR